MMSETLRAALIEWRAARQHIFDNQHIQGVNHGPAWDRLAKAEHALMSIARTITEIT